MNARLVSIITLIIVLFAGCGGEPLSKEQQATAETMTVIKAGDVIVCTKKESGQLTALQVRELRTPPNVIANEFTQHHRGALVKTDLTKFYESCASQQVTIYPAGSDEASGIVGKLVLGWTKTK